MAARRTRSVYVHGTSRREQARLGMMNRVINEGALRLMSIRPGERIVDFGSGLGQLTRAFARAAGRRGRVVGIERSPDQLRAARRRVRAAGAGASSAPIDFRLGDALDPPLAPDEWGSFDTAHTRFLLEHLPAPSRSCASWAGRSAPAVASSCRTRITRSFVSTPSRPA